MTAQLSHSRKTDVAAPQKWAGEEQSGGGRVSSFTEQTLTGHLLCGRSAQMVSASVSFQVLQEADTKSGFEVQELSWEKCL